MANQNDAGRDKKLMLAMIGVAIFILLGAIYLAWGWVGEKNAPKSRINMNGVATPGAKESAETPAYRELLREQNKNGAQNAKAENSSFIASIPVGEPEPINLPEPKKVAYKPVARPVTSRVPQTKSPVLTEDQKKTISELVSLVRTSPVSGTSLTLASEPGAEAGQQGAFKDWTQSIMPQPTVYSVNSANSKATRPAAVVVPAFTIAAGSIDMGVDSDNSDMPVTATIGAGRYSGAVLKADRSRLAGDGVVIHFTAMSWKERNYTVDAYALKDDTLMANVSTDVSRRYIERVFIPSIASGIGETGSAYKDTNTTILNDGYSTVTSRAGTPDGRALTGMIVGGTAANAGKVMNQDAAKLPPVQVTVKAGQPVYIKFMSAVTTADEITKISHSPNASSIPPQDQNDMNAPRNGRRYSLAELRARNNERVVAPAVTPHSTE